MTSAQVGGTLVTTTDNSPSQNRSIIITNVNQQYLHINERVSDLLNMLATSYI